MVKHRAPMPSLLTLKTHVEELLPKFRLMLQKAMEEGSPPLSMSEALVVVLLKPDKAPKQCSSYRPMSLNVGATFLAKLLAGRLDTVITALVHVDQSRFMPGRGTNINIQRLLTHLSRADGDGSGLVAFLDAEKNF